MTEVAPGAEFETSIDWGETGLTGTLRVRLLDGEGGTAIAPTTAGITEFPAASGRYEVTMTAPDDSGDYQVFWDDGVVAPGHTAPGDDITVTIAAASGGTGPLYITVDELKVTLAAVGETFMDADITDAVNAASRAIDNYKGMKFYPLTQTRYFTAQRWDTSIPIGELLEATSVRVDNDGDYDYLDEEWVEGTDYVFDPPNAAVDGRPQRKMVLLSQAGRVFPTYRRAVKITGSWGWSETPSEVKQAAKLLALRLLHRSRSAPLGIVSAGSEMGALARVGKIDQDVAFLLDNIGGASAPLFV